MSTMKKRGNLSKLSKSFYGLVAIFIFGFCLKDSFLPLQLSAFSDHEAAILRKAESAKSWEEEQVRRRNQIKQHCEAGSKYYRKSLKTILKWERERYFFIVNDRLKFIYCYIPKVACTNWKRIMMALSGKTNGRDLLEIHSAEAHSGDTHVFLSDSRFGRDDVAWRLQNYTKFMFVRHPTERLVSAFRDKFETNKSSSAYFKATYGSQIIARFRKEKKLNDVLLGEGVKFNEFMKFLMLPGPLGLNYRSIDEHWNRYVDICNPCAIDYDFIGKYENLEEDAEMILRKIGAPDDIHFPHFEQSKTPLIVKKYFDTVDEAVKNSYFDYYDDDFVLFDYEKKV